jgi:hypothetical protein
LFTRSAAVLFDLRSSLSSWKICRAIRAGNEFVPICLNSHSVIPDMFDRNAITKMALGESFLELQSKLIIIFGGTITHSYICPMI